VSSTYSRTYTNAGKVVGAADPATVTHFVLDKYVVTVGRFRQFVAAWAAGAGYFPPAGSGKHAHVNGGSGLTNSASSGGFEPGWKSSDDVHVAPTPKGLLCDPNYATWTTSAGSNENLPINCVTWYEAYAFCIWDGGFLPSEAEWELVAAGGSEQREYPWGKIAPGSDATYADYGCLYPSGAAGVCHDRANIAPVGSSPMGAANNGALDLAGDVSEWTLDWEATYVDPCVDCAYLDATAGRVVRGSSFASNSGMLHPWLRALVDPAGRNRTVGFRCAKSP
jgi:formylglycine-generating enzyme required for sulfatase activity